MNHQAKSHGVEAVAFLNVAPSDECVVLDADFTGGKLGEQVPAKIDVSAMLADLRSRTAALACDLALLGGYIAGRRGEVH